MVERLEIINYFNDQINEIDLKAEHLLTRIAQDYHGYIDAKRKLFIDEIEHVKAFNLSNLNAEDEKPLTKDKIFKRYCFLLEMDKINRHRMISTKKRNFLYQRQENMNIGQLFNEMIDSYFGVLIVLDGYLSDRKVDLFKELLHFHENYFPYEEYSFEEIKNFEHFCELNRSYDEKSLESMTKSNIFKIDGDYNSDELYWYIWLQYDIFKKPSGFIIKTNQHELFRVNYLYLNTIKFDSISDEALELFHGDISLFVHIEDDFNRCMSFLKWLQANVNVKFLNLESKHPIEVELSKLNDLKNLNELKNFKVITENNKIPTNGDTFSSLGNLTHLKLAKIGSFRFDDLKKLTLLDLSHNNIVKLESDLFNGLNNLRELNLSYNELTQLPIGIFRSTSNLESLKLNNNKLSRLDDEAFSYSVEMVYFDSLPRLKYLTLSHNPGISISEHAFDKLKNLQQLDLMWCGIKNLNDLHLEGLINLRKIYLVGNEIDSVTSNMFRGLSNLQSIDLTSNKISEINNQAFDTSLQSLTRLELLDNGQIKLQEDIFMNLTNLSELSINCRTLSSPVLVNRSKQLVSLNLSDSHIYHIDCECFEPLSNLRSLNLDKNYISSLPARLFCSLSKLERLSISINFIEIMDEQAFEGLTNLRYLCLDNNSIDIITEEAFYGVENLQTLSLDSNQIENLDFLKNKSLNNLRCLYLGYNQIKKIHSHNFNSLTCLLDLDLSSNVIKKIDADSFKNFNFLRKLNLFECSLDSFEGLIFSELINTKCFLITGDYYQMSAQMIKNRQYLR